MRINLAQDKISDRGPNVKPEDPPPLLLFLHFAQQRLLGVLAVLSKFLLAGAYLELIKAKTSINVAMPMRSHHPKKISLRKRYKGLLRESLEKRVRPSRAELKKVKKEEKKPKSRPQATPSSLVAKPSTSSEAERLTAIASNKDQLPEAPNPLLESNAKSPGVQNQTIFATNHSNIDESNITAVDLQGQSQAQTFYPLENNTLATSAPYSEPYLLPISEENRQWTAPSFTSSIIQASDLEFDINDSFLLPDSTQTTSWTEFSAPSIQSPLPDYTQDFGNPSGLAWSSNMGQDVQQGLPPPGPDVSSSSSAGQELNLVKVIYDGGYPTRQEVEFDGRSDFNFIAQSYVDVLQRSSPIQVLSFPPGVGRKTQCPNGALINIEQILYAKIEFESHLLPFPPTRVYFVVYDDFKSEDGINITLGRDWVGKIEQAYPRIGYQGQR
ncbi:hypothetical protein FGADI_1791 [Fusarium gaditjirri]|uniref:Uncharacterized protein n=1 Tax=Fusarium gaditjirri TaxID=282569 RepID=A0A8H4TK54_9HYPO|nr:hypothetical protein FGADI_1791 [Fusarium gaditjirri]